MLLPRRILNPFSHQDEDVFSLLDLRHYSNGHFHVASSVRPSSTRWMPGFYESSSPARADPIPIQSFGKAKALRYGRLVSIFCSPAPDRQLAYLPSEGDSFTDEAEKVLVRKQVTAPTPRVDAIKEIPMVTWSAS